MKADNKIVNLFIERKKVSLVYELASRLHEEWRKSFDSEYAKTGIKTKERIKKNSDGTTGDINISFSNLHPDWQKENIAAAEVALLAFMQANDKEHIDKHTQENPGVTPKHREIAAEIIHNKWMERNPKEEWNASQHVPYSQLSEEEKNKDRLHYDLFVEIFNKRFEDFMEFNQTERAENNFIPFTEKEIKESLDITDLSEPIGFTERRKKFLQSLEQTDLSSTPKQPKY